MMKPLTLPITGRSMARVYLHIRPKFEKGTYLENEIAIPEDLTGRRKTTPKKREMEEIKKKAPSVQDTQVVGAPGTSARTSTYMHRKRSPVKEEVPEQEKLIAEEKSPEEEEEKAESPILESPVRKKQKVMEEADSEETESLEKYMGERDDDEEDEPEGDQEPLVFSMYDSGEEGVEEKNDYHFV
ncbi:hypothetical protein KI387_005716 [Taxus chinensis]|uniref:Uncharacterized protein n=1 Tax=Taxus chinensis TaxID=29808 RepID=A0AA38GPF5_TAXCH|nr:hypothetical protein KI387_005716 [Taxus chinensis]